MEVGEQERDAQPATLSDGVPASGFSEADMATNARLKERALRFWLSMVSQPVTLHMYENELTIDHLVPRNATQLKCSTTVEGTLCAVDAGQEHVQMSGLATPMYRYPEALVRTSDIRCLVAAPAAIATSTTTDPSTTLS